jgi:hypothetical protein
LREDLDELVQRADDGSYTALLEAADIVREHVIDMERLLEEHERFRIEHSGDSDFMALEYEALDLCAKLGDRTATVIGALTDKADELMRGGARLDRGDIREFVESCEPGKLTTIVDGLVAGPPYVPLIEVRTAFEALVEKAAHGATTAPPLPEPTPLVRILPEPVPDPVAEMADELLALRARTPITDLVISDTWPNSACRYGTLMETIARRRRRLPPISLSEDVVEPRAGGVWRLSKTTVDGDRGAANS